MVNNFELCNSICAFINSRHHLATKNILLTRSCCVNGDKKCLLRTAIRITAIAFFAVTVSMLSLSLNKQELLWVSSLDDKLADLRTALLSHRAKMQRRDVCLVLISEDTLSEYPARSPVDRGLLGDLVRAVDNAGPRVIGLDFIFDWKTPEDDGLLTAIHEARRPVVLGAIDDRDKHRLDWRFYEAHRRSIEIQKNFLAEAIRGTNGGVTIGHLFLEQKGGRLALGDSAVRRVASNNTGSPYPLSFSQLVVNADGAQHRSVGEIIAWQWEPDDSRPLFFEIPVRRHKPAERKSVLNDQFGAAVRQAIAGNIVLIGAEMRDSDQHMTPLSVLTGKTMAGVRVQAQIVTQHLDGRMVGEPPEMLQILVIAALCSLCFFIGHRKKTHAASFIRDWSNYLLFGVLSWAAFWRAGLILPTAPMLASVSLGLVGGRHSDRLFRWIGLER
jgi:adenylate cyclase